MRQIRVLPILVSGQCRGAYLPEIRVVHTSS